MRRATTVLKKATELCDRFAAGPADDHAKLVRAFRAHYRARTDSPFLHGAATALLWTLGLPAAPEGTPAILEKVFWGENANRKPGRVNR